MITLLIENLIPLYILIGLGFIAGRWLEVNLHSMAIIAIFILSPVVIFGAIVQIELDPAYLLLPVIVFSSCALITYAAYKTSYIHLKSNVANLVGMACGTGNTGYYGLPILLAVLDAKAVGIYMLMNLGLMLSELTYGYYIGARGNYSPKDSLRKVIKLPALYATILALIFNMLNIEMPEIFDTYWNHFTGAWVIIGMMLIGVGLSKVESLRVNISMLSWMFAYRFIVWPLLMFSFITLDQKFFGLYDQDIHFMLMLMGLVPLAANTVAFAGYFKLPASEAAMAVLLSTIFALFYIPFILGYFL